MLEARELKTLSTWCTLREIRWRPLSGGHTPSVLLEPAGARRCWQRMVLSFAGRNFELMSEAGEKLASASDLTGVLDALEGGVAEAVVAARPHRIERDALAYVV